ncbi:sensor histidine kinase [Noviherbaspirillum sp.]|uniref:sensor histidine kinase n=1 Tax=Noviherbaspirillum sp. TaxID=1926288 RepID=UPI002D3CA818|nr:sensor histidine kinase [Noviherbaspirillum sp.]HZW22582.1 sensor histidine kinase [Noviherbaspirillum sp.]
MTELIQKWFSTQGGIMPPGGAWTPELAWTFIVSDAAIGLAYYSIPLALLTLVRRRRDLRFTWLFVMFSAFIFACGTTHFIAIWTVWNPHYWTEAAVRAVTAAVSVATAVMLWKAVPRVLQLPSTTRMREAIDQLEHEIQERRKAEDALRQSQATLRELAAYQERVREDERKRIAREIHDELGQNLLALRLDVSALHARAGARHPRLKERAETALDYIDTTMKSIRSIMNNLRPPVLDLGLPAAIEWQVTQFERRNNLVCEVLMNEDAAPVPETQATAVFRILQESLNNIGRHARASYVRVELRIDGHGLEMMIKDDGVGMHPGDRRKAHRFGLIGMEERVAMLGGELRIDSTPGQGTVLRVIIPFSFQAADAAPAQA